MGHGAGWRSTSASVRGRMMRVSQPRADSTAPASRGPSLAHVTGWQPDQPTRDPLTPWWRAAVVLRVLTYGFAIGATAVYDGQYARPALGWILTAAIGVWTLFTGACYLRENSRWFWLTVLDL